MEVDDHWPSLMVDGPHLHVVADAVVEVREGVGEVDGAGRPDVLERDPVGVGLVRRVAADMAQVIGGDPRHARGRRPGNGERAIARGDRVDGGRGNLRLGQDAARYHQEAEDDTDGDQRQPLHP